MPANDLSDCLVSCECDDRCSDAEECGCQDPSELSNEAGKRIYAYNRKASTDLLGFDGLIVLMLLTAHTTASVQLQATSGNGGNRM